MDIYSFSGFYGTMAEQFGNLYKRFPPAYKLCSAVMTQCVRRKSERGHIHSSNNRWHSLGGTIHRRDSGGNNQMITGDGFLLRRPLIKKEKIMGTETTGFVHCRGLDERIEKAKRERNAKRIVRRLSWPRGKREKFWQRVNRWYSYIFDKHGPGPQIPYDKKLETKKLNIATQAQNRLAKEESYD